MGTGISFYPPVPGDNKANMGVPPPTFQFFRLWRTAQTRTSTPVEMVARVAALRLKRANNLGTPFHPIIRLSPSTRYHSTSGTSSKNFTPSIRAFSKALACAKEINVRRIKLANRAGLSIDGLSLHCNC